MLATAVDGHMPEQPDCIAWSNHNQIALCTPKIPRVGSDGGLLFTRGSIWYDRILPEEPTKVAEKSISLVVRGHTTYGFRQAVWWMTGPVSRLVLLTYSGTCLVLECTAIDLCDERCWKMLPEYTLEGITCLSTDWQGNMVSASELGAVTVTSVHSTFTTFMAPLITSEIIIRMCILDNSNLIIVTSNGRVLERSSQSTAWRVIINDHVLMPGPLLTLPERGLVFCKFNRIYHLQPCPEGGEEEMLVVHEMPRLWQPLVSVVATSSESLLAIGMDGQCFQVTTTGRGEGTVARLSGKRPWLEDGEGESEEDEENPNIGVLTGEEGNDDTDNNGEGFMTAIHGATVSKDGTHMWVVESKVCRYPRFNQTHLFLYNCRKNCLSSKTEIVEGDQQQFIKSFESPLSFRINDQSLIQSLSYELGSCPVCLPLGNNKSSLTLLLNGDSTPRCICSEAGHILSLCDITRKAISSASITRQCHRCGSRVGPEVKETLCSICHGTLLKLFP